MEKRILIVYHSEKWHTMFMALNIEQSLKNLGVGVCLREVDKCLPEDMLDYDGVILGSPTYFSNMSWQVKKFLDESASLRLEGVSLEGKIGGSFTSSVSKKDGLDCIKMIEVALQVHHRMRVVTGIVAESDDSEENIVQLCHEYSRKIIDCINN